jgi:hypothetical protein
MIQLLKMLSIKNYTLMNKIQKTAGLFFLLLSLIFVMGSCQRKGASCPAYTGIDPNPLFSDGSNSAHMSKEKFVNAEVKPKTPEDNKKEVEKRKNDQMNKKYNRKKSTNLFPSYMR